MVSRLNWSENGQTKWVCFELMSAGPRGRNGIPERPSCSILQVYARNQNEIGIVHIILPICVYKVSAFWCSGKHAA